LDARDHGSPRERLRTLEAHPVLSQQWAARSTHSAAQVRDILRQFLGDQDRIVVAEVGEERTSRRALVDLARV